MLLGLFDLLLTYLEELCHESIFQTISRAYDCWSVTLSGMSLSAVAQNQTGSNQSDNMTTGGGNMTLQEEGTSGINMPVARNQSVGGGGGAPS